MYDAIVVDDSKPILRNIARQIEAADSRIRVVATLTNGRDALARLRSTNVDIVFSDIKMPVMDGLQLLSEAKSRNPDLRCVVISGYDDFELARQAIQLGVDEYILKPVATEELKTVLAKIVESVDRGRRTRFEDALSRALKDGVTSWRAPNDALRGPYGICLLRFGALRDGIAAPERADVRAAFGPAGPAANACVVAEARGHSERAVVWDLGATPDERWRAACQRVFESMVRQGRVPRMACSNAPAEVAGLPSRVTLLSQCLEENVCLETPTLLWMDRLPAGRDERVIRDELARFREEARLIARGHSVDEFRQRVGEHFRSWRDARVPLLVVRRMLETMVCALEELRDDSATLGEAATTVEELLRKSPNYDILTDELCRMHEASVRCRKDNQTLSESIVRAATELFCRNLDRTLSMGEVANRLGFSVSYVHRVLRSALGKAPMEYYTDMKIAEAKRLLERFPNIAVKDIARSLGFEDQHYFSRVFKSHVAQSPVQYRQRRKHVR